MNDIQSQIVALVQAAMQGDQQASQQIQAILDAAKQGDQQALQIAQMIQAVVQQMKGVQSAKNGSKLNYIKYLRGKCPEGYELGYYKQGGHICKKCMKKEVKKESPVEQFKQSRKKGCNGIKFAQNGSKTKNQDLATRDSILVNKYNDQEIQINRPGSYQKDKDGNVRWVPDRTKAPYKKKK